MSSRYLAKSVVSLLSVAMSKPPAPSDLADKFMLRLPDGMRERLKAQAEAHKRSMNAEIVARLEATLPPVESAAGIQQDGKQEELVVSLAKIISNVIEQMVNDKSDPRYVKTIVEGLNSIPEVNRRVQLEGAEAKKAKSGS